MFKYLTKILIITLFLTSPLSFAGDRCPDFTPIFEVEAVCSVELGQLNAKRSSETVNNVADANHKESSVSQNFQSITFTNKSFIVGKSLRERASPVV